VFFLFIVSCNLFAQEYIPEGLYDLKSFKLNNGFEVFLRERHEVKNTSIRLVVKVGHDNFECGKQEIAHFLEHLLFTGTSKHSERELDKLIEDNGGSWNATTSPSTTSYEIDIYSKYTGLALKTLHEIVTDSTITPENVELSRDIIHRELGGVTSKYKQVFYDYGIGKSGYSKSSEKLFSKEAYCSKLDSATDITRDEIMEAHQTYYVPNNMAIVIVGDFDSNSIREQLNKTFGLMKRNPVKVIPAIKSNGYQTDDIFTGTLNPVLSDESSVYIRYRVSDRYNADYLKLAFISVYLKRKLFNAIRIEKGLAYSANASLSIIKNREVLELSADSEIGNEDIILEEMLRVVDEVLEKPIDQVEFDKFMHGILLSFTQMFQSNDEIASYYVAALDTFLFVDEFKKLEIVYNQTTPEDVYRVANKYLKPTQAIKIKETPVMAYMQFYISILMLIITLVYLGRIWFKHHRKK